MWNMSRRGVFTCVSLIVLQVWITVVAFTSTSLVTNPNSEVFPVSHDDFASSTEANTARSKRNETNKEHREIIAHFQRIEKELEEQKEELQSINREIQTLGLSVGHSQHEEKIKNCLLALHQYLEHPDEQNRNIFTDEAAQLSQSLTAIVGGLLGKNVFNPDIMAVLREATGCHGRTFAQENQAHHECRYDRTLGSWRIPTNKERVGIGQFAFQEVRHDVNN
ncbi:uncharacterized protein LOC124190414 [Daphnia pulex]|uniref:uncharacterized protein LOC124190414 n=1 Tax=Daphnia pulex TaxID=6669 RepID=UPI001EDFD8DB|nr:uncharacterized protein LOC124190414 [Daphnia pulex]